MNNLVIFMPKFKAADPKVLEHNFQSFVTNNPDSDVVIFDESELEDYTTKVLLRHSLSGWRNTDLWIYDFYRQHPGYERYMYVEWDSYCTMNVRKMLDPVWALDLVGKSVRFPKGSKWWVFRQEMPKLPDEMMAFACGIAPICGVSATAKALEKMSGSHILTKMDLVADLRMATLARSLGIEPAVYPIYGDTLYFDRPLTLRAVEGEGIWHRLKVRYFPPGPPKEGCQLIGRWTGTTSFGEAEFELCPDGIIRSDVKERGQWVYVEADRELLLSWDHWGVEWYQAALDVCRNGPRYLNRRAY